MPVIHVAADHASWRPCGCLWAMLLPRTILVSVVFVPETINVYGSCCHWEHVDIGNQGCHRRPYWCLWSLMPPKTMLLSMIHAGIHAEAMMRSMVHDATGNHVVVHGLWSLRKPWSMLLLAVMDKEASVAVISMNSDSELRMRDTEGFYNNSIPTHKEKRNSLDRRPLRRVLKC